MGPFHHLTAAVYRIRRWQWFVTAALCSPGRPAETAKCYLRALSAMPPIQVPLGGLFKHVPSVVVPTTR